MIVIILSDICLVGVLFKALKGDIYTICILHCQNQFTTLSEQFTTLSKPVHYIVTTVYDIVRTVHYIVRTVPKYNLKIVETEEKWIIPSYIYITVHSPDLNYFYVFLIPLSVKCCDRVFHI